MIRASSVQASWMVRHADGSYTCTGEPGDVVSVATGAVSVEGGHVALEVRPHTSAAGATIRPSIASEGTPPIVGRAAGSTVTPIFTTTRRRGWLPVASTGSSPGGK